MTCRRIDELINAQLSTLEFPLEAAEHIAACDRCTRLVHALNTSPEVTAPSASQLRHIQSLLLRDLRPVRPLMSSPFFLFAFGLLFLTVVAIGSRLLGVSGWGALGSGQKIVIFSASVICGILLALSMIRQMVPGSKHAISPTQLLIGVLALPILVIAAVFQPQRETAFVSSGLTCLRIGMTYSISSALLLWLMLRRGAWLSPKLTGATAGIFVGLIGVTVLEVYCPNLNLYHILIWHLGVIVLNALAGLILGATVERMGRSRHRRTFRPVPGSQ